MAEHGLTERNDISIYCTESVVSVPTSGINCRHEVQVKRSGQRSWSNGVWCTAHMIYQLMFYCDWGVFSMTEIGYCCYSALVSDIGRCPCTGKQCP